MSHRLSAARGAVADEMFELISTLIPGCLEIRPRIHGDARGRFVKVFNRQAFAAAGLNTDYPEEFYSVSHRGVVRGLHFQSPPMDHIKLVYCVAGQIQDAVLDLRRGSPTYGRHVLFELSAEAGNMVYIPRGLAHGFCALSETAILVYKTSSVYSPTHDCGVLWNSVGIRWAATEPVLSKRDRAHPPLEAFQSPFCYEVVG